MKNQFFSVFLCVLCVCVVNVANLFATMTINATVCTNVARVTIAQTSSLHFVASNFHWLHPLGKINAQWVIHNIHALCTTQTCNTRTAQTDRRFINRNVCTYDQLVLSQVGGHDSARLLSAYTWWTHRRIEPPREEQTHWRCEPRARRRRDTPDRRADWWNKWIKRMSAAHTAAAAPERKCCSCLRPAARRLILSCYGGERRRGQRETNTVDALMRRHETHRTRFRAKQKRNSERAAVRAVLE